MYRIHIRFIVFIGFAWVSRITMVPWFYFIDGQDFFRPPFLIGRFPRRYCLPTSSRHRETPSAIAITSTPCSLYAQILNMRCNLFFFAAIVCSILIEKRTDRYPLFPCPFLQHFLVVLETRNPSFTHHHIIIVDFPSATSYRYDTRQPIHLFF